MAKTKIIKKKTTKKKVVKIKTCEKCPKFAFMKHPNIIKDYYFEVAGAEKTVAFLLTPMDFYGNLKKAHWIQNILGSLPKYNVVFLPYLRCYERLFDSKKPTPTSLKICRDQFIKKYITALEVDLLVVFPGTKDIVSLEKDDSKITFPGNWGDFQGAKVYYAKSLYSVDRRGFDTVAFDRTVMQIDKFCTTRLIWQKPQDFRRVTTLKELEEAIPILMEQEVIAIDVETSGLNVLAEGFRLKTIGIFFPKTAFCLGYDVEECLDINYKTRVKELLTMLFQKTSIAKVCHNIRYEQKVFMQVMDIDTFNNVQDTMFLAYLFDENRPSCSLKALAGEYLDGYPKLIPDFESATYEDLFFYNCLDCYYTLQLFLSYFDFSTLNKEIGDGLKYIYDKTMIPLSYELALMELLGAQLDYKHIETTNKDVTAELAELNSSIAKEVPQTVGKNLNSNKQLSDLLFNVLKYPVIKRTKTGNSTDKETLVTLAEQHDCTLATKLIELRKRTKQQTTYITPYLENREFYTYDRVRTSYMQTKNNTVESKDETGTGTTTGRLSSSKPNLQNIPRDKAIKNMFVPTSSLVLPKLKFHAPYIIGTATEPRVLLQADLSQAELRIAASVAFEENMLKIYNEDGDIHYTTGMSTLPPEALTSFNKLTGDDKKVAIKAIRQRAKAINFGLIYGGSAKVLKQMAKIQYGVDMTDEEAEHLRDAYFVTYPGLLPWHTSTKDFASRNYYILSPLGRIRRLPELHNMPVDSEEYGTGLRRALNAPIQGTCADILSEIWTKSIKEVRSKQLDSFGVLTVHDSLVLDTAQSSIEPVIAIFNRVTNDYHLEQKWLGCPIRMDFEFGKAWGKFTELADIKAECNNDTKLITNKIMELSN